MKDDQLPADTGDTTSDEPIDGGILDEFDDAVIAADATGMLATEKFITDAEIELGLEGKQLP
jgi:hypothetical protein